MLPDEPSTFVGRQHELAEARTALGLTRLLTVLGPGGIGKTRFAARLALTVSKLYRGNIWFFDLSAVAVGGSVIDHVATNLSMQTSGQDPAGEIAAFFGDSRVLLVFDGCEHVLESARTLIRRLVQTCPGVTIIATSQAMLRLSSEYVYVLDPLPIPGGHVRRENSAVQLFLDRIRDVMPDPSADQLDAIGEICRLLDGIPLAIELAATRVRALTPRQILDRLDAPLAFLTRGDLDLPDRQRTLTSAIAWSYELCTDDERELWRLMAVFTGPWALLSAERMAAGNDWERPVIDVVESLLEKSILRRRQNGSVVSYTMFDAMRRFGLEMSTPDERVRAMTTHRDWHISVATKLEAAWFGPDQLYWLELTQRALPNLRAAIQFSIDHGDADEAALLLGLGCRITWIAHGRGDELRRWVLRVLDMPSPRTQMRCQILALLSALESSQGDLTTARRHLAEAEELAEGFGNSFTIAAIEGARGYIEPDPAVKIAAFERGLAVQGGVNQILTRNDLEERLADAHNRLGHTETANAMIASLVERARAAGDRYETSNLLFNAGITATARDDLDEAASLLRRSLVLKHELDNRFGIAMALDGLARVAAAAQDYERTATLLGATQSIWGYVGAGATPFSRLNEIRPEMEDEARRLLGARAFTTAYRRGQNLSVPESVDFALGRSAIAVGRGSVSSRLSGSSGPSNPLSKREREVAGLVEEGLSDSEIAKTLSISRRTAEGHVAKSLQKLGFSSRTQLAAWSAKERKPD
ncbi:LuxR C-terminal-related transcriptional regulator [Leifsonia aquatica]|uniref:LuxR C-terminal-related transcriptional regulator n=1 Tax=Leifsonia aquatica TaxID=144185 RepID=UPI00382AD144